jgi:hypothetical protein
LQGTEFYEAQIKKTSPTTGQMPQCWKIKWKAEVIPAISFVQNGNTYIRIRGLLKKYRTLIFPA